ncbi:MAG TPA: hypothetical protein VLL25_05215 [Acidimicrobiales bacterium]|nr:hypothetical protein [Acidimicrobiales bacterium]
MQILDPTVAFEVDHESPTFDVGLLAGKVVGLRLDRAWRSYMVVIEEWEKLLRRDMARPRVIWTGGRIGDEGETTRSDLNKWSDLIDCGVVGLGN